MPNTSKAISRDKHLRWGDDRIANSKTNTNRCIPWRDCSLGHAIRILCISQRLEQGRGRNFQIDGGGNAVTVSTGIIAAGRKTWQPQISRLANQGASQVWATRRTSGADTPVAFFWNNPSLRLFRTERASVSENHTGNARDLRSWVDLAGAVYGIFEGSKFRRGNVSTPSRFQSVSVQAG